MYTFINEEMLYSTVKNSLINESCWVNISCYRSQQYTQRVHTKIATPSYWTPGKVTFSINSEWQGTGKRKKLWTLFWENKLASLDIFFTCFTLFPLRWSRDGNSLIRLKKTSDSLIGSFLVSDLRDSLTLLIFGERPERFAHIPHKKRGNERIAHFFK